MKQTRVCFLQKKQIHLFVVLSCMFLSAFTQNTDSLKISISLQKDDIKKLETIFILCDQSAALHPDSLKVYINLANKIIAQKDFKAAALKTAYYEIIYYIKKSKVDSAENLINSTIEKLQSKEFILLKHKILAMKSNILIKSNRQKEAIQNSLQLLSSAENNADTLTILRSKITIGWAYMELNQYPESLKWFLDALKTDKLVSEKNKQPVLYSNIGAVYNEMKQNDSAEVYIKQAIYLAVKGKDFTTLANAYNIYADINIDRNNNVKAEELLQSAFTIRKQIGDPFFIVSDIYQLGIFYAHIKQPYKGIVLIKEGIDLANKSGLQAKLPILYEALAQNYRVAGKMELYSETLNQIISLKDSLYKNNSAEELSEMQTKYDVQKKENIIILQKLALANKNYLLAASLFLLAGIIGFGFFYFRWRKKNQQLKMQQILADQEKNTAAAVVQAEELERKRIAGDLHDSVAQKLVVAKLNLEAFESYLPVLKDEHEKVFKNIFSLVDDACNEVRSLSHSMMPQAFFKSGLTDAVKNLIDKISGADIEISFNSVGNISSIDKNKEIMIYRVIQECIQNTLKHAKANKLDISIIAENEELDVTIEDNGIGFDLKNVNNNEHSGLKNIQNRIEFLNGKLDIDTRDREGTIIAFYVPLK